MKIEFKVRGQTLVRADNRSVAGNSFGGFLQAGFEFGDDWAGLIKVAVFTTATGSAYDVVLGTGQTCECEVAHEAVSASETQGGFFYVSVRGVDAVSDTTVRGTANRVRVDLEASGAMQGGNSVPATPSEVEQILAYIARGTWLHGSAVSGTGTGIEAEVDGAAAGVHYLNVLSGNVFVCAGVDGATSTWDYVMSLKGGGGGGGDQPTTYITPEMCGAVGDGETDDTDVFKVALVMSAQTKLPLIANGRYRITEPLDVHFDLIINGLILYEGGTAEYAPTHDRAALILHNSGDGLIYNSFDANHFKIRIENRSRTAPIDKVTGVKIYNCRGCTIDIDYVKNFYIGAELHARGRSFWTTKVTVGIITEFRYGLVLAESYWDVKNSGASRTGAFNQCLFFGGHFFNEYDNGDPATTFRKHDAVGIFLSSSITAKSWSTTATAGQTKFGITYDDIRDWARIRAVTGITVTPEDGEPYTIEDFTLAKRDDADPAAVRYNVTVTDPGVTIGAGDQVEINYETESTNRKSDNIFISPCIEYLGTGIEVAYGSGNWFYGIRGEGVQFAVRCTRYATSNRFFVGYNPAHYECDDTTSANVIVSPEDYVGGEFTFNLTKDDVIANLLSVNEEDGEVASVNVDGFYNYAFSGADEGTVMYDIANFGLTEDGRGLVSRLPSEGDLQARPYIGLFVDTSENKDVKIDFIGTQAQSYYRKVAEEPADWSTSYSNYYTLSGERMAEKSKIRYTTPYAPNAFYNLDENGRYVYVTDEEAPADWVEGEDGYVAGDYRGRYRNTPLFNANTYYSIEDGEFVIVADRPADWNDDYINYAVPAASPIEDETAPEFDSIDVYELVKNGWTPVVIEFDEDGDRIDDADARPQHKLYSTKPFCTTKEQIGQKKYFVEHTFFGNVQTKVAFTTMNEIDGNKFMLRVPEQCKKAFVGLIAFWEGAELDYIKVSTVQPNRQIVPPNKAEEITITSGGVNYKIKAKRT